MPEPAPSSKIEEFRVGSPGVAVVGLVFAGGFVLFAIGAVLSEPREWAIAGGAVGGAAIFAYAAWKRGQCFHGALVTQRDVELKCLFGSQRILRSNIGWVEMETVTSPSGYSGPPPEKDGLFAAPKHEIERYERAQAAAIKFRILLVTRAGNEYRSTEFDDADLFVRFRYTVLP